MVQKSPPLHHSFEQPDVPSQDRRRFQRLGGNTGLLSEKWDDCSRQSRSQPADRYSRRTASKTGKRWLDQRDQVENVPRTLGHLFEAQEGRRKGKFYESVPSLSGTFFQAVFSNGTDWQNHAGETTGMENFYFGCQVCDE